MELNCVERRTGTAATSVRTLALKVTTSENIREPNNCVCTIFFWDSSDYGELNGLSTYVNVRVSDDLLFIVILFDLEADTLNGVHGTEAPVTSVAADFLTATFY